LCVNTNFFISYFWLDRILFPPPLTYMFYVFKFKKHLATCTHIIIFNFFLSVYEQTTHTNFISLHLNSSSHENMVHFVELDCWFFRFYLSNKKEETRRKSSSNHASCVWVCLYFQISISNNTRAVGHWQADEFIWIKNPTIFRFCLLF
jgi:hypothetical protein